MIAQIRAAERPGQRVGQRMLIDRPADCSIALRRPSATPLPDRSDEVGNASGLGRVAEATPDGPGDESGTVHGGVAAGPLAGPQPCWKQ
jgi:hypothetical protein